MEKAVIKVKATTNPGKLAGAIASEIRENKIVEIQAIGAGSINQAIKAVAIARGFVASSGYDLKIYPSFANLDMGQNGIRTGLNIIVEEERKNG